MSTRPEAMAKWWSFSGEPKRVNGIRYSAFHRSLAKARSSRKYAASREGSLTPYDLARALTAENRELRELLVAVAGDLERLACEHPQLASRLLARAQRLRARLCRAGS